MSDSPISGPEHSKESWFEAISEIPFPVYILANKPPYCRLVGLGKRRSSGTIADVTLTYFQYPSGDVGPQILGVETSVGAKSTNYWPSMPIYQNEDFARSMMDYVRLSFPEANDVDLETLRFLHLVEKTAETEEYQAISNLRFHCFHVDKPFALSRAYTHIDYGHLHVIAGAAGFSRSEFSTVLDSLVPARGSDDVLLRQVKEFWLEP